MDLYTDLAFKTNLVPISTVDTDEEMNWLVSSYYETEANVVFIRNSLYIPSTRIRLS